ncbi:hypothetical protein NO559_00485 [Dasania sp. GY-MA-18]|uniref:AP2 domain-containing protein n=1 Tax=Dasania phycosphaerae TaxID=2950436 RepID=A0A9J6RHH6_9GAMM|nr:MULTISPECIES: hypothetical protein [Dasania]MCR8921227.1 hypothetical protein [Dasania sp. GY-MA-18]MCZ0863655.1 hypothetical protein [Dasania phycosphaerae]MCZ0867383.1 hypothetical protein [Dasania phycosphaerae]
MSVKLIDNEAFYGFRVRRTINGELYQEYFSLKSEGVRLEGRHKRRVEQDAFDRDKELAELQQKTKQQLKADRCFNPDGTIKGISYLLKTEKSGTITPIFQVGISSEIKQKIVCTSFSVNAHGEQEAWKKAIETYAKHKAIRKNTKLYQKLLNSKPKTA